VPLRNSPSVHLIIRAPAVSGFRTIGLFDFANFPDSLYAEGRYGFEYSCPVACRSDKLRASQMAAFLQDTDYMNWDKCELCRIAPQAAQHLGGVKSKHAIAAAFSLNQ
jgi:hypothetical protein